MDPQSLQMHCLKHVLMSQQCSKRGCTKVPMSFQILRGEEVLWCQEHYEYSQFYHDALCVYYTHHNGHRPFRVHIGNTTAYIYNNTSRRLHQQGPLYSYENIVRIFLGDNNGKQKGNTILLEIEPQRYVYIGQYLYTFETEEVIEGYHSYLDSSDIPRPRAVGEKYVYCIRQQKYYDKAPFSLEMGFDLIPFEMKGLPMVVGMLSTN